MNYSRNKCFLRKTHPLSLACREAARQRGRVRVGVRPRSGRLRCFKPNTYAMYTLLSAYVAGKYTIPYVLYPLTLPSPPVRC